MTDHGLKTSLKGMKKNMGNDLDVMKYYQAAEKIQTLVYTIEITMQYMDEFEIKPDEDVKRALHTPMEQIKKWLS